MSKSWVTGEQMYFGGELYENPSAAYHFGAKFKEYFKWNTGKNFLKIKDSGVYKLKPLEKTNSVVAKVYQKDYPDLLNYYLEYRVPFGYDESINDPLSAGNIGGLIINKVGLDGYGYPEIFVPATYQLDMSPTTNGLYDQDWYDVALLEGNVFEDKGTGIKIKHLGINSNLSDPELMFSVEFSSPQCIRNPPYWWRFDNQPITLSTKSTNWLSIPIRNSDSLFCSPSEFNVTFQFPKNWNYSSFEPLTIEPDNFKFGSITIDLLNDVIPGNYSTNVTFKNLDSGLEKDHPVIFKVLPP